MDESKNESKTIVIVPTKIFLNTFHVSYFIFTARKEEREKEKSGSIVHFFHRLYNLSQVGNALYISFLDKNQETLDDSSLLLHSSPALHRNFYR